MKLKTPILAIIAITIAISCNNKDATKQHEIAYGIDVSHHQGKIDWKKVSETPGLEYVYIKASEGSTYTDPEYKSNIKKAKESGLMVGAYHFYSEKSDIKTQFNHFRSLYPKGSADLIPMLDIEPRGKVGPERIAKIRKDVDAFRMLCKSYYGEEPMLYIEPLLAEKSWLGSQINDNTKLCIGHPYKTSPKLSNGKYTIWQYTYSGNVNGIPGKVDLHRFNSGQSIESIRLN